MVPAYQNVPAGASPTARHRHPRQEGSLLQARELEDVRAVRAEAVVVVEQEEQGLAVEHRHALHLRGDRQEGKLPGQVRSISSFDGSFGSCAFRALSTPATGSF